MEKKILGSVVLTAEQKGLLEAMICGKQKRMRLKHGTGGRTMIDMYCDKCGKIIENSEERIIGPYYTLAFNGVEICKNCADELRGVIDRYLEDEEE